MAELNGTTGLETKANGNSGLENKTVENTESANTIAKEPLSEIKPTETIQSESKPLKSPETENTIVKEPQIENKHNETSELESKTVKTPEVETKVAEVTETESKTNGTTPHYDIPKTCKAAVVCDEGPDFYVEVQDVPVPEIGPDDVLLKINATGICLSDIHAMLNDWGTPKMSAMGTRCAGHEGAGVIVKIGDRVKNLKVGMRAGFKPIADTCAVCEYCRSGRDTMCLQAQYTGNHVDGSFKQYVLSPARYTTLIPDGVSDYVAGPVMCSASTIYASIKASGLRPGQWAVFPGGGGGVGIQGVQLAVAMGIRPIVIDTGDVRQKLCTSLGAEHFIDFATQDHVAEVLKITEGGAHAVFVTAVQSYPIALDYLGYRAGGQVMCIGLPPAGKYHIDLDPTRLVFRSQSLKGTLVAGMADVDETLDFAKRGKLRMNPTVVGLSKFNESVQKLKNGQVAGRIVVDFNLP